MIAHGIDDRTVAANSDGTTSLTPDELAVRIKDDGLQLNHRSLKLVACRGCQFATYLKDELQKLGYAHLRVYGYTEDLYTNRYKCRPGYHKFAKDVNDNPLGRAKISARSVIPLTIQTHAGPKRVIEQTLHLRVVFRGQIDPQVPA